MLVRQRHQGKRALWCTQDTFHCWTDLRCSLHNSFWSDLQSCYCSTSGTFAPEYYDGFWSSCLSFASVYDPAEYSQLGPTGGGVFTGSFPSIAISHGLGSSPCQAWYEYTQTTTPRPIHSTHGTPPPETRTSSQGGHIAAYVNEAKVNRKQGAVESPN